MRRWLGTRNLSSRMEKWGFTRSRLLPALFSRAETSLDVVIHVDDMLVCGRQVDLGWFKNISRETYEVMRTVVIRVGDCLGSFKRTVKGF